MDRTNNGQITTIRRMSRAARRKRSTPSNSKRTTVESNAHLLKPVIQQRVFLYMQLNDMQNLPDTPYPLELHLYHSKNTLQKLQERYTTDTIIFQHEFGLKKPVFVIGILQDNIDDMNTFSDNPLVISLYQRIPRHHKSQLKTIKDIYIKPSVWKILVTPGSTVRTAQSVTAVTDPATNTVITHTDTDPFTQAPAPVTPRTGRSAINLESIEEGDEEGEGDAFVEESLELLSRGHCDLLQLFQSKRFISNIEIYLYPEYQRTLETPGQTAKKITTDSVWHMYSIMPLLKTFTFTNLAFITLESIYNAPVILHDCAPDLGISLSFRATEPSESGEILVIPLCTYYGFTSQIISDQNINILWETMKRDINLSKNFFHNQMETNSRIKLPRLFRQLLYTEGVQFNVHEIDALYDRALINNSLHRYVLSNSMRAILEETVVDNNFELLVQLYSESESKVLYEGVINLSVFGYPSVNYCRFATKLSPVEDSNVFIKARQPRNSLPTTEALEPENPTFAIIKICFFQPITERNEPLNKFNEDVLKRAKLRRCFDIELLNEEEDERDIVQELYRAFHDLISEIIAFIVKRDIHSIDDRRDYFCCQLGNLSNLLLKICGSDYNVRIPTKTNIEFREMLTLMYKELMDCIYRILISCGRENLSNCVVNYEVEQMRIIRLMEEYRFLSILGMDDIASMVFEELKSTTANKKLFNFYVFLFDVERLNFAKAANYLRMPKDRDWDGEYFASLVNLYINYMMEVQSEDTVEDAYSNLLETLRVFARKNSLDQDTWTLLYCYYKNNNYLPGMEYTRWKYENLLNIPRKNLAYTPQSLFELYLPIDYEMKTSRSNQFYKVFKLFARLGAYGFAEVIFMEISDDCPPPKAYLIATTLKMLQHHIDESFKVKNFPTDQSVEGKLLRYFLSHINGNVEYTRSRFTEAVAHFKQLLSISEPDILPYFYLSLLRLGNLCLNEGNYDLAKEAYEKCLPVNKSQKNFTANYGMGLSLYYMNHLEEAIPYFARCTETEIFIPDVWGFLALVNLRLNKTKRALDCWKMAKLYPEMRIHDDVYRELDKIKFSDVSLMVDDDDKEELIHDMDVVV